MYTVSFEDFLFACGCLNGWPSSMNLDLLVQVLFHTRVSAAHFLVFAPEVACQVALTALFGSCYLLQ